MTPTANTAPHILVEGVGKYYGSRHGHAALRDVNLTLEPSSLTGIVGESGSGKSTLAKIVAGLEQPSNGAVYWDGSDLRRVLSTQAGRIAYRQAIQLIAQDTTSSFDPRRTFRDTLRIPAQVLGGMDRIAADAAVDDMVHRMGLPTEFADRFPAQLSGGQRQRMSIARALIVSPRMLICDEAVSALDVSVQGSILNLLKRYCRQSGAGLLFVSHGLPATAFITDSLIVMKDGEIVERGNTKDVLDTPKNSYTSSLVAAYAEGEENFPASQIHADLSIVER
ncbi:MAG: dipeptide/oligopeptide/nickel ABC transporter ATP-binding protein [Rhodococcus sp. (in: high G+C Gram-positive bacteria)]|uniref:ABC transporter ATP-binding protein n=1 Tax=Rhodococcus sp. TaxID=1831 RepID=UPI003BB07DEA